MRFGHGLVALLTFFCLVMAVVDARAQGKAEKDKVRIGYAARAVAHSVPYVAREAGFLPKKALVMSRL